MKFFKTKSGLELPFANIKGKDYILVPHRVQWFREEHPDWAIETSRVEANDQYVIFRAEIRNHEGRLLATAHKREDYAHFGDAMEKAETSAIGRALALCGYGTQFAHELDEGSRLVDSPLQAGVKPNAALPEPSDRKASAEVPKAQEGPITGLIQWTPEQKREYLNARFGTTDFRKLSLADQETVAALSKSQPFRVAMSNLGSKT